MLKDLSKVPMMNYFLVFFHWGRNKMNATRQNCKPVWWSNRTVPSWSTLRPPARNSNRTGSEVWVLVVFLYLIVHLTLYPISSYREYEPLVTSVTEVQQQDIDSMYQHVDQEFIVPVQCSVLSLSPSLQPQVWPSPREINCI